MAKNLKRVAYQAGKIPRVEIELGKIQTSSEGSAAFIADLKPQALYRQKRAIIVQVMATNVAPPDACTTGYTAVTVNNVDYDPDGLIKNAAEFTGLGGTNNEIELAEGFYHIRTEFSFARNTSDGASSARQQFNPIVPYNFLDVNTALDQFPLSSMNARSIRATNGNLGSLIVDGFFEFIPRTQSSPPLTQRFQLSSKYSTTNTSSGVVMNLAGEDEVYGRVTITKIETPTVSELSQEE